MLTHSKIKLIQLILIPSLNSTHWLSGRKGVERISITYKIDVLTICQVIWLVSKNACRWVPLLENCLRTQNILCNFALANDKGRRSLSRMRQEKSRCSCLCLTHAILFINWESEALMLHSPQDLVLPTKHTVSRSFENITFLICIAELLPLDVAPQ